MRISVILFTYNRPEHTKKTLEGIKNNIVLPDCLYIFQDGCDDSKNVELWNKVNEIINKVDFCKTEVHVADKNNGLSYSVKNGIDYVMSKNDAAIILEDDCVPHPLFIEYAIKALEKYQNEKKVWSINGYSDDVDVEDNGYDAYFTGRTSSWGWATWKDRWKHYNEDYTLLRKIRADKKLNSHYRLWGEDLENYLVGNIEGRCDSWAVFWSLQVIFNEGYCLTPYKSLINNIGLDGTGTHSGKIQINNKKLDINGRTNIELPNRICYIDNYQETYLDKFHWTNPVRRFSEYNSMLYSWVAKQPDITNILLENTINSISLWGSGPISELLISKIDKEKINIVEIIKSKNYDGEEMLHGIKICDYSQEKINEATDLIIVIPFFDIDIIRKKLSVKGLTIRIIGIDRLINGNI